MSKKLFIKGTLLLTFAGLASRLIGFFYRIFLSHTIGAEGLGIFQLVMPLQILALAFCASGIQTAISRLTASREALGCPGRAGDYFISGTLFSVLFSLVLSFLFYYRADFWAVKILKEPRTASLIRMMAPAVPLSTLHTCINSYYFGRKKAGLPAGIQLLEQAFRVGGCYVIYLVCISEKRTVTPLMAAGGNLIGETAACIASLFFISMHFKEIHYSFFQLQKPLVLLKELFHISIPLSLNKILLTVLGSMEVILIPGRLQMSGLNASDALSIYGIFTGMALPLILFPATLTNSVAVMLLPSVTELQTLGISEKDPVCDPSDFPVLCIFRRCLYAPFPVLWKIYGDFFIPQHYCRHVYPHYVLYLSIPVSQYYPHQRAEWSGKIRDLSDTQCSQPMYPGSFCTLCHTDFRNPGISVRDTIQRTYPYSTAYHCALCSW